MKQRILLVIGLVAVLAAGQVEAYTSRQKKSVGVGGTGVSATSAFDFSIVARGTADVPTSLSFGSGGSTFRDSGANVRVTVNTNLAGNRIILYTDNRNTAASPRYTGNPANGVDGGGLVGATDTARNVPMFWAFTRTNGPYTFDTSALGVKSVFVTDKAHVASFTPGTPPERNTPLDNQDLVRCSSPSTTQTNTDGDGLYPQFFGAEGQNLDLCHPTEIDPVTGTLRVISQELTKNIATVAFLCSGTTCNVPDLTTTIPSDVLSDVVSPFYLPIGANFTGATAQSYATNTFTLELITDD